MAWVSTYGAVLEWRGGGGGASRTWPVTINMAQYRSVARETDGVDAVPDDETFFWSSDLFAEKSWVSYVLS